MQTKEEKILAPKFTKITLGSSGATNDIQGKFWLAGTGKEIMKNMKAKGFNIFTSRPSRAMPKVAKAPKAKKASTTIAEAVAA